MPQNSWSAKRERLYAHIKEILIEGGKPEPLTEEIAARTVNKERSARQARDYRDNRIAIQ